jgi:hypothetical protein
MEQLAQSEDFILEDCFEPPHGMVERLVRRMVDSGLGPIKHKSKSRRSFNVHRINDPAGLMKTIHSSYSGADAQHSGRGRNAR